MIVEKLGTPSERLLAVADLIEQNPEHHYQGEWAAFGRREDQMVGWEWPFIIAERADCGSTGCACGWGVAMTPTDQIEPYVDDAGSDEAWHEAGMIAFGIPRGVAEWIFGGRIDREWLVDALRFLGSLPDGGRTLSALEYWAGQDDEDVPADMVIEDRMENDCD